MNILRVGQIASTTLGAERAGTVTVKPGGKLTIDAQGITENNVGTGILTSAGTTREAGH